MNEQQGTAEVDQAIHAKPWFKIWWVWVIIVVAIGIIGNALGLGKSNSADPTPVPSAATFTPSEPATASATPSPSVSAELEAAVVEPDEPKPNEEPASEAEVLTLFQDFYKERSDSGVKIAQSITSVSFVDGVVSVTFDPASIGWTQELFDSINPFDNMAVFAGTVMAFEDEPGIRLRTAVTEVRTFLANGTSLGQHTAAELYELGTGNPYQQGR